MTIKQMGEENGEFHALMAHLAVFILDYSLVPSVFPHSWLEAHIFKMHSHLKKGDRRKKGGENESL